jgi:hypothetical protein
MHTSERGGNAGMSVRLRLAKDNLDKLIEALDEYIGQRNLKAPSEYVALYERLKEARNAQ